MGEVTRRNAFVVKSILRCSELASGLKVNFSKSKVAGVALEDYKVKRFFLSLFWSQIQKEGRKIFKKVPPFLKKKVVRVDDGIGGYDNDVARSGN